MIQVMLAAPVELARLFAPAMAERGFGRILNVASLAGQMPATGGDTLYGPIKSFLIKASQGLHLELRGTGVHVTALCPGYTLTEFHDVNGTRETTRKSTPDWLWMGADEVAEAGLEALEANRPVCVPGAPNKTIAALARLMPEDWALALMESQGSRFRKT
jgi:short-subunit dehydrogenase